MNAEFAQQLTNLVQAVSIAHGVWRGSPEALADLCVRALEKEFSQAELDDVRRLLFSQPLAAALINRDVALWVGADKLMRLVDQSPSSLKGAMLRTAHHSGDKTCRYCLLLEPNIFELIPETDSKNEPIQGSMVHKHCANAWRRLRQQVGEYHDNSS